VIRFNEFAFDLKKKMDEGSIIKWKGIGTLEKKENRVNFQPEENIVVESPVKAEKIIREHAEHTMLGALLYLMCDDLGNVIRLLKGKGVDCATPVEADWGISTSVRLPSGGEIGLYQPTHPTMIEARST